MGVFSTVIGGFDFAHYNAKRCQMLTKTAAVVHSADGLNIRALPSVNPANIIGLIPDGTTVLVSNVPTVTADGHMWVFVIGTFTGWVANDLLSYGLPVVDPVPITGANLLVSEFSQFGSDATLTPKVDCGPTALKDAIWMLTPHRPTVDDISAQTSLAQGHTGLTCAEVAAAGRLYDLVTEVRTITTFDPIVASLKAGYPIIPLVNYSKILKREDQGFGGGHFPIIVGYQGDIAQINDPDVTPSTLAHGDHFQLPIAQLMQSIASSGAPGQCVFITGVGTPRIITPGGIDLYHRQPWPKNLSKIKWINHKSSEGDTFEDDMYQLRRALWDGPWGATHFMVGGIDPKVQAAWFVKCAQPDTLDAAGRKAEMWIDLEGNPNGQTATLAEADEFAQALFDLLGRWPKFYGNRGEIPDTADVSVLAKCGLVIADWTTNPYPIIPKQWSDWYMWQKDTVYPDGTVGYDADYYNGTFEQLIAQWGK